MCWQTERAACLDRRRSLRNGRATFVLDRKGADVTEERCFRIAVLGGTGAQGSALALRLARAGHQVVIGSRDAERARLAAGELGARTGTATAGADNRAAAAAAEIAILTVPYAAQRATVEEVVGELQGKILVDATVPLVP